LAIFEKAYTPIGNLDTSINSHAIFLNSVLITKNIRHIRGLPELRLEIWLGPSLKP